ncbi:MAG: hypothetical protein JWO54_204 [Candidatus Saccharibacteria bacterium]|nr:hypothetical protein [Candidatus Saccharibacteria bacterium]MDB5180446.1 hypothetical protein [Candidatus Saccharibacteria bacterium]
MTTENLYNLAEAGKLGRSLNFEGYCLSAAIDSCFNNHSVPLEVYEANQLAVTENEIGNEGIATDTFYQLLGRLAFKDGSPEAFMAVPYYLTNLEELQTDLSELRGNATILLDTHNGAHSVGLKPVGNNYDDWQIVGTHQIVAAAVEGEALDVQGMITPEIMKTEQV